MSRDALKDPWRLIASAAWPAPSDCKVYGKMEVDLTDAEPALEALARESLLRLTPTHLVSWAVARALAAHPAANAQFRFGQLVARETVDLFVNVALQGGARLSGVLVKEADQLTLPELAWTLRHRVKRLRRGQGDNFSGSFGLMGLLPTALRRPILRVADFVGNDLQWDLPSLGIPANPFGSAIVTSMGMFGVEEGYAPFFPLARAPMILMIARSRTAWR